MIIYYEVISKTDNKTLQFIDIIAYIYKNEKIQ